MEKGDGLSKKKAFHGAAGGDENSGVALCHQGAVVPLTTQKPEARGPAGCTHVTETTTTHPSHRDVAATGALSFGPVSTRTRLVSNGKFVASSISISFQKTARCGPTTSRKRAVMYCCYTVVCNGPPLMMSSALQHQLTNLPCCCRSYRTHRGPQWATSASPSFSYIIGSPSGFRFVYYRSSPASWASPAEKERVRKKELVYAYLDYICTRTTTQQRSQCSGLVSRTESFNSGQGVCVWKTFCHYFCVSFHYEI